jgi:hypothetical protein
VVNGDHADIVQQLAHEILHADETNTTKPDLVNTLHAYIALQPAHATAHATAPPAQPDWRRPEEVTVYLESMPLEWQLLWAAVHNGSTERVGLVVGIFSRRTFSLSFLPPPLTPSTKLLVIFLARCMSYLTAAPPLFFSSDSLHSALESGRLQTKLFATCGAVVRDGP